MKKRQRPTVPGQLAGKPEAHGAGAASLGRIDWQLVGFVLAVKVVVVWVGVQAFLIGMDQPLPSPNGWLAVWNQWDAPHYLDIARDGYVLGGEQERWIVFYPLYPWLIRAAAFVLRDELVAAFLVSAIASVAAALLLKRLGELDEPERVARLSVFFLFAFPTAYFLHIGYTESLFLALALGSFLAARRRRWPWAGALGALAAMTRINGLLLIPALAVEAFLQYREGERRPRAEWLWIALVGAGFGVYLLVNWQVFGDPWKFLWMQERYWDKELTWPWVGIRKQFTDLPRRPPSDAQMVAWQEMFFVALGLACTVWSWLRLRTSYAVWMTCNWLLWTSTKFILSAPRYTLVLFPMYFLLARVADRRPAWGAVIALWSLLLMGLFITRFVQGYWAF
ncbi:MAG TPA: glycosyltransferase family 39 protein [Thermoanaerobaculia bacterium]|nr:glycosyltransferase family 39 protein [Thermoanaerobaculia bacterium]